MLYRTWLRLLDDLPTSGPAANPTINHRTKKVNPARKFPWNPQVLLVIPRYTPPIPPCLISKRTPKLPGPGARPQGPNLLEPLDLDAETNDFLVPQFAVEAPRYVVPDVQRHPEGSCWHGINSMDSLDINSMSIWKDYILVNSIQLLGLTVYRYQLGY